MQVVDAEAERDLLAIDRRLAARQPEERLTPPRRDVQRLAVVGQLEPVGARRLAARNLLPAAGGVPFPQLAVLLAGEHLLRRLAEEAPRGRKLLAMKPPSGRPRTELRPIGSGATAQPIHVSTGVAPRVSTSNTSIDSRLPWPTTKSRRLEPRPGSSHRPCVVNRASGVAAGGPGQPGYFFASYCCFAVDDGYSRVEVRSLTRMTLMPPVPVYAPATTHWPSGERVEILRALLAARPGCTSVTDAHGVAGAGGGPCATRGYGGPNRTAATTRKPSSVRMRGSLA